MSDRIVASRLAAGPNDYERLGIKKDHIEQWEDGMRTDGRKGTYEWWYFDAHLSDGSKTVIVFYTKDIADVGKPLAPFVAITLDRPDGTHLERKYYPTRQDFSASRERCGVRIGPNTFSGDLHTYQIHVEAQDIVCDLTLTGTVPPWRPETGYLLFGERAEHYFAWLPSVPQGDVHAVFTVGGQQEEFIGIGYHDHNWGNISMTRLIHDWYWARGKLGDYTAIASYVTAEKRYGYKPFPVFMLAHKGQVVAADDSKVSFSASDFHDDEELGKPVANVLVYDYKDGDLRYVLTFKWEKTILRIKLVEGIQGINALLARLVGFDGTFMRFTGDVAIGHYEGDKLVGLEHEEAIWEQMYFGRVRKG